MTPPPDSDDDLEEARVLEAQARKDLEAEGCPPCYPADFELPLTDPPPEYLPIIRYFENDGVYLYAQLSEWQRFRQVQEQDRSPTRSRYRSLTFDEWLARIRRRRERNGLSSDVSSIKQSLSQQDRLGNWVEYQDFALKCFQGYYNDKGELEKERDEGLAKGEESWPYERRMEYIEREMEKHKILLQWIEEQRLVMVREQQQQREQQQDSQNSRHVAPAGLGQDSGLLPLEVPVYQSLS